MYTYLLVSLNSFSSTTSKYKAFGTTIKTVATTQCLKNFKKYKKCLLAIICPVIVYKIQKYSCPAIVCPAIVYELHKTLTLHNPNTLYITTKIFIYCPCPASPTTAGISTFCSTFLSPSCITTSSQSSSSGSRWSCRLQSTRIHMLDTSITVL